MSAPMTPFARGMAIFSIIVDVCIFGALAYFAYVGLFKPQIIVVCALIIGVQMCATLWKLMS